MVGQAELALHSCSFVCISLEAVPGLFLEKEHGWESSLSVLNTSFAATERLRSLPPLTPLTQSLHNGWNSTSETLQHGTSDRPNKQAEE